MSSPLVALDPQDLTRITTLARRRQVLPLPDEWPPTAPYTSEQERAIEEYDKLTMELRELVDALPHDARLELTAVMWTGRDDDEGGDWDGLLAHARSASDAGDTLYLVGKMPLGEYLDHGWRKISA